MHLCTHKIFHRPHGASVGNTPGGIMPWLASIFPWGSYETPHELFHLSWEGPWEADVI